MRDTDAARGAAARLPGLDLREVPPPHSPAQEPTSPTAAVRFADGDPHPWYEAVADLDREIAVDLWGYDDLADDARDLAAGIRNQQYTARRLFVVTDAGRLVAYLSLLLPLSANTHLVEAYVVVRPGSRGRGIGTTLASLAEHIATDAGRTTVFSATEEAVEPPAGPGVHIASTGSGRVSADLPGVRFATRRGYALEQVERHSVLELSDDGRPAPGPDGTRPDVDRLATEARDAAGPGYRLHTWTGPTPDRWLDGFALLMTRMSTDAPTGGVDYREDPWDAARVRAFERELADQGQTLIVAAAEHTASGTMAAFTLVACPEARPQFVWQGDTLVLAEHRGRRLGMLVKTANLAELARLRPGTRRVHTGNAEENRHMLAINVALGFLPAGGWGLWQRRLAPEN